MPVFSLVIHQHVILGYADSVESNIWHHRGVPGQTVSNVHRVSTRSRATTTVQCYRSSTHWKSKKFPLNIFW